MTSLGLYAMENVLTFPLQITEVLFTFRSRNIFPKYYIIQISDLTFDLHIFILRFAAFFSWSSNFGALRNQLRLTAGKPREFLQTCKPTRTSSGGRTAVLAERKILRVSVLLEKK